MKLKLLLLIISFVMLGEIADAQNTWIQKPLYGGGFRSDDVAFVIGSKGYVGTGWSNTALTKDIWAYDTLTNTWSQIADFGGSPRSWAVGFSIGLKGYIGTGLDTCTVCQAMTKDFWEYNSLTNSWTQKADFGGTARYAAVGFSINGKGYIGTGNDGVNENDFWEYDTTSDSWTQKAFFGGLERMGAFGLSIGNKGYIGGGSSNYTDFWEYNPSNDTWTQKADINVYDPIYAQCFAISGHAYVLTDNSGAGSDLGEYDPVSNTWVLVGNLSQMRNEGVGFAIGNKGYVSTGNFSGRKKDLWQYTPCASFPSASITANGPTTFCSGGSVTLTASTGASYQWWSSETTQSIVVTQSGTYAVIVTDSCGTATSSPITVTVNPSPSVTITPPSASICVGESISLTASPGPVYLWSTSATTSSISVSPTTSTTYSVTCTGANGCTGSNSINVVVQACTGIIEPEADPQFAISPNPFSEFATLQSSKMLNDATVSIYNSIGQQVEQINNVSGQSVRIDRNDLPYGVYLIRIIESGDSFQAGTFMITE